MKRLIKKILFILPRFLRNFLYIVSNWILHRDMLQKRVKGGDIDDGHIYYVIRTRTDGVEGVMALLLFILKQTWYADKHGYIPVVDMKNYHTQYNENDIDNAFLYFFKPKNGLTVEEVYKHKNVILSSVNVFYTSPKKTDLSFNDSDLLFMKELFDKYYEFSIEVMDKLNQELEKLHFSDNWLGVYARGTDYVEFKPAGHPRQPSLDELFNKVDEFIAKYHPNNIFFVSEDKKMFDAIKDKYGDLVKIASFDTFISDYKKGEFISKGSISQLGNSKKNIGINYIVKLLILGKCDYIVTGQTCGSWSSVMLSGGFIDKHIFKLGNY